MTQTPLIDPAIDAIARDDALSDALKQQLIGVAHDTTKINTAQSQAQSQFTATHKRGRWNTPLWVALTGLITLGGNFAFDYWRTEQAGQINQSQAVLDAKNDREIAQNNAAAERALQAEKLKAEQQAQALSFQYEVIKTELANLKTAEDRANSLRLLVRIGVLGEPLKLDAITAILKEVKEGKSESLPSVGGTASNAGSHVFKPCRDIGHTARVNPLLVQSVNDKLGDRGDIIKDAPAFIEALRWAMINNGICSPEQVALVFSIVMSETKNMQLLQMTERTALILDTNFKKMLGNASNAEAILYRGRGMTMIMGKRQYASYAKALNRPDLLENPDIVLTDPSLSADILIEALRSTRALDVCPVSFCDVSKAARRYSGGGQAEEIIQNIFDVTFLSLLE